MRGAIFGNSQLKWLCRERLFLDESVQVCTFSYPGATVRSLREKIDSLPLQQLDFVVVYIGGNNLQNGDKGSAVTKEVLVSMERKGFL